MRLLIALAVEHTEEVLADGRRVLAANVRRLRRKENWTQEELALEAAVGLQTVRRIEQEAEDGNVTLDTLIRLAAAFGVPVDSLLR